MSIKASRFYGIGLALLTVGSFAACSSEDTPSPGTAGSSNNTAGTLPTAGTTGTGGTSSTGGTGAGTAGTSTAGTGTAGTATAGAGTGGTSATACAGTKPAGALITEFADLMPNPTSTGQFSYTLGVPGGTFAYQVGELTVTNPGMALNVKGKVMNYDGFGVYTTTCMDASAFTGVSFSIKGNAGMGGKLNFRVQTNSNTAVDLVNKKGTCVPVDPKMSYPDCHPSALDIPVTADAKTIEVKFSELTGGVPVAAVTGKDIVGFEWSFAWAGGTAADAYDVDVTLDDLKFTGGSTGGTGNGGTGGMGGSGGAVAGTGGSSAGNGGTGGS
jgi:hypothetical protein